MLHLGTFLVDLVPKLFNFAPIWTRMVGSVLILLHLLLKQLHILKEFVLILL